MPKKDFGVKPQVAAAREREANKKEADKQVLKRIAKAFELKFLTF
jgi:hypothetical protein